MRLKLAINHQDCQRSWFDDSSIAPRASQRNPVMDRDRRTFVCGFTGTLGMGRQGKLLPPPPGITKKARGRSSRLSIGPSQWSVGVPGAYDLARGRVENDTIVTVLVEVEHG